MGLKVLPVGFHLRREPWRPAGPLRPLLLTSYAALGGSLTAPSLHTLTPEMDTIRGPVSQAVLKGQGGY